MRRRQLIEIEDQSWCPAPIRDGLTDYLQFVADRTEPYRDAAPILVQALQRSGDASAAVTIVDLAAGAGGPWRRLLPRVTEAGVRATVMLTDLHPNTDAFAALASEMPGVIRGESRSVSADAAPRDLEGFRTMFTAFHHFPPAIAERVLADAVKHARGIAIFESTTRDFRTLPVMLFVPLAVWLMTPFIRPFRISRLLLTYILPLIPFVAMFDGIVSALRTYTVEELRAMAERADPAGRFEWSAGETERGPIPMTYLVGVVKKQ
jgi:hypothetical protein